MSRRSTPDEDFVDDDDEIINQDAMDDDDDHLTPAPEEEDGDGEVGGVWFGGGARLALLLLRRCCCTAVVCSPFPPLSTVPQPETWHVSPFPSHISPSPRTIPTQDTLPAEIREIARQERERLRMQAQQKMEALERLRSEENQTSAQGAVRRGAGQRASVGAASAGAARGWGGLDQQRRFAGRRARPSTNSSLPAPPPPNATGQPRGQPAAVPAAPGGHLPALCARCHGQGQEAVSALLRSWARLYGGARPVEVAPVAPLTPTA